MCLYTKYLPNKRYVPNKKNKGIVPICDDHRKLLVPIKCGFCEECRKQEARNWQIRLTEHIKKHTNGKFITFTFSEKSLTSISMEAKTSDANEIAGFAIRRFLERFRKHGKRSVNHWLITELGHEGTERIHVHGILFTNCKIIERLWGYGNVFIGKYVNQKTINYIVKYITKIDNDHPSFKGKVFTSPGIGAGYITKQQTQINKYKENETNENYRAPTGHKLPLPIYYRNKIYTEEERDNLWTQKLDKEVQYIMGSKYYVRSTKERDNYNRALEYAQKRNKEKGYGNPNWERKKYMASKRFLIKNQPEYDIKQT